MYSFSLRVSLCIKCVYILFLCLCVSTYKVCLCTYSFSLDLCVSLCVRCVYILMCASMYKVCLYSFSLDLCVCLCTTLSMLVYLYVSVLFLDLCVSLCIRCVYVLCVSMYMSVSRTCYLSHCYKHSIVPLFKGQGI